MNRASTSSRWSPTSATRSRLLADQRHLVGQLGQVVGPDLGAEPVLERRDDPAAVGVVLRVGGGDQEHVQRQPQRVAADLDVALLQHVEQRHLDPLGQVGQLVEAEHAAVGPRHQAVVHGLRVAEGAALGDLDRVDVTDQVADRRCRGWPASRCSGRRGAARRSAGRHPSSSDERTAADADRLVRVVVDLAAGDLRAPLVEQLSQGAHQPGLALAALAEQDQVVAGQQGGLELGQHRVVEADDAGEGRRARAQPVQQVGAELLGGRAGDVTAGSELTDGRWGGMGGGEVRAGVSHERSLEPAHKSSPEGRRCRHQMSVARGALHR